MASGGFEVDNQLTASGFERVLTESDAPQILVVRKTADTEREDDDVPSDDPHLTLAVEANSEYIVEACLFAIADSSNPDIRVGMSVPTSATALISISGENANSGSNQILDVIDETGDTGGVMPSLVNVSVTYVGFVKTAGNAGNYAIQWSQNTADITNGTTVLEDSWLRLTKLP